MTNTKPDAIDEARALHLALRVLVANNCIATLDQHLQVAHDTCPDYDQKIVVGIALRQWPTVRQIVLLHLEGRPVWPENLPAPVVLATWECASKACAEAMRGLGAALGWLDGPQQVRVFLTRACYNLERGPTA